MVKVSWYYSSWMPRSLNTVQDWLIDNLGERTVQNMNPDEVMDDTAETEHHYYEGNENWQYHYVRTVLLPNEEDMHLYAPEVNKLGEQYYMAAYFVLPDDATAVMMKLALSE